MGGGPMPDSRSLDSEDDTVLVTTSPPLPQIMASTAPSIHADDGAGHHGPAHLVYAKSKVYIHLNSREYLPGWMVITSSARTKKTFWLSWIPESLVKQHEKDKFVEVEIGSDGNVVLQDVPLSDSAVLETATEGRRAWSVPINSIYSVVVVGPTLANWYGKMFVYMAETAPDDTDHPFAPPSPTIPLYFHDDESPSSMLMMDKRSVALGSRAGSVGAAFGGPAASIMPASWGGEEVISTLRKYANVVKSSLQPNLYLVNPSQSDLDVHSVPLFEDEERVRGNRTADRPASILHQSLSPAAASTNSDALPTLDDLTFNVMASFSRLTNKARKQAQTIAQPILAHPLSKPILKHLPPPIASLAHANAAEHSSWAEKAGVAGYDAARVYLARWARVVAEEGEKARRSEMLFGRNDSILKGSTKLATDAGSDDAGGPFEVLATTYRISRPRTSRVQTSQPVVLSEWRAWFDSTTGKLQLSASEAKRRIFQRGLSLSDGVRKEAWPFLLNVYEWDSTAKEREDEYTKRKRKYEDLRSHWFGKRDVTSSEDFVEEHHRIQIDCLRTDRTQAMFAAHADQPTGSRQELLERQHAHMEASTIDPTLRGADAGGHPPSNYHVQKLIEILLTYNQWETELGYVQGMSDLCSPLYITLEGDVTLVFWCFVNLMEERMKPHFYRDQSGMKRELSLLQQLIALMDPQLYHHLETTDSLNLFFCFRWVLIAFKREFKFDDVLCIWEAIWSSPSRGFHLFIALGILESHRSIVRRYLTHFDEILKYINELSGTLEPQSLLSQAEVLYLGFCKVIEVTDRRTAERASCTGRNGESELRQRKSGSVDMADPLVKLIQEEAQAEAKVPDLVISDDLRALV